MQGANAAALPAQFVGGSHGRWPMFYILPRAATAAFGTVTVLWVYRIGLALFDE
jgi:hypothetical protein